MEVDSNSNVVVTGVSYGLDSFQDIYTAKYAAADGKLIWERRDNDPVTRGHGWPGGLVIDAMGNVAVTASISNGSTGADLYTAKYAAGDGALIWERKYSGPGNARDEIIAVAADGGGNVFITARTLVGQVTGSYTAKYAAADGGLLWEKTYSHGGGADGGDTRALVVDANGNAIVTGYSFESTGTFAHTAKFAAADGALLWAQRTSGPSTSAIGKTVALDGEGNVVIAGSAWNGISEDFLTAKYAAADGAVLWERYYDGPGRGEDVVENPRGLALGPEGMAAITGSSQGAGGVANHTTVVYRESSPPLSFVGWVTGFGLAGETAAANADPDNDGVPSAVEFILGSDPSRSNAVSEPAATIVGDSVVFTFLRDDESETPDAILTVEAGNSLGEWPMVFQIGANTAGSSPGVAVIENRTSKDTITVSIPRPQGTGRLFARLKVTIRP